MSTEFHVGEIVSYLVSVLFQIMLIKDSPDIPELDIQKLLDRDPYLTDHKGEIERRFSVFQKFVSDINNKEGGISQFALGHKKFGPQIQNNNDILVKLDHL